jgi:hypothetical protein
MGMFDEVECNHELFGVHRGEVHQTKDLHDCGGLLDRYEITPSGRLEFLVYRVEDRSDPTLKGIARWAGVLTTIYTGGRRDLNYHGWLALSCFGRAKFTEGTMVVFEPEPNPPSEAEGPDENGKAVDSGEWSGLFESDPNREFRMPIRSAVDGKTFRRSELPSLNELEAFVSEISPEVRSRLAWLLNRFLGLDTNAIRQMLKDKSIAEEWLRFGQESE